MSGNWWKSLKLMSFDQGCCRLVGCRSSSKGLSLEKGLWKLTPLSRSNEGGVGGNERAGLQKLVQNFLWGIWATFWNANYLVCFDYIGRILQVSSGSLVHPKIGGWITPAHPWADKYTRVVLKSVQRGPKGTKTMKTILKVVPNVPTWC